jgi:hypothetical protein
MYAADGACIKPLEQVLEVCYLLEDGTGAAVDVYHV